VHKMGYAGALTLLQMNSAGGTVTVIAERKL